MFSFRTTPLIEQEDLVFRRGRVAVLCSQSAWFPDSGEYLFETLYRRGTLAKVFVPCEGLFGEYAGSPIHGVVEQYSRFGLSGTEFVAVAPGEFTGEMLSDIDAIVIEYQDTGSRYDPVTELVCSLFETLVRCDLAPSVYVLDRENPCGRGVEGTMGGPYGLPQVHGLTTGELALMMQSELGAHFSLHVISYLVRSSTHYMLPWSIPAAADVPGMFTFRFYSGMNMLKALPVSVGEGSGRPYEMFGAPWMEKIGEEAGLGGGLEGGLLEGAGMLTESEEGLALLCDEGVFARWCRFTPARGAYAGQICYGYQLMPQPGPSYHSVSHFLRILRYLRGVCPGYEPQVLSSVISDKSLEAYVLGLEKWAPTREYMKEQEQKWMRKAKKYILYDDKLVRGTIR